MIAQHAEMAFHRQMKIRCDSEYRNHEQHLCHDAGGNDPGGKRTTDHMRHSGPAAKQSQAPETQEREFVAVNRASD